MKKTKIIKNDTFLNELLTESTSYIIQRSVLTEGYSVKPEWWWITITSVINEKYATEKIERLRNSVLDGSCEFRLIKETTIVTREKIS